jgi:hypothetical protein
MALLYHGIMSLMLIRHQTAPEIINRLGRHGCQNLTGYLDPSSCTSDAISRGGFGEIYSGNLYDGRKVAIKTIFIPSGSSDGGQKHLKVSLVQLTSFHVLNTVAHSMQRVSCTLGRNAITATLRACLGWQNFGGKLQCYLFGWKTATCELILITIPTWIVSTWCVYVICERSRAMTEILHEKCAQVAAGLVYLHSIQIVSCVINCFTILRMN